MEELRLNSESAPVQRYSITDLEGEQAFHTIRAEWEKLWWSSEDATESQTWHWQYLYWRHLAPKAHPVIIIARDSHDTCVALAAFFICRDPSSWICKAAFLGDKKPDYHLILARPDLSNGVGLKILEHFALRFAKRVPYLELSNVPKPSYTGSVLGLLVDENSSRSATSHWETHTYAVPLPKTLDEYLKQLGPRSRRDFRYDRRQLCSEFSVDFRVYRAPEDLDEALNAIEAVDRARWGSNSRYCLSSQRLFERSIAHALGDMGIYRAFVLYLNGIPRAFVSGAVVRDLLKVASIGFDRSVPGRWSIGKVTNFYAIEYCIQEGLKEYDLTRGGEDYKKWLGGVPRINLHWRLYRSRYDQYIESHAKRTVSFLRRQSWLHNFYQSVLRR